MGQLHNPIPNFLRIALVFLLLSMQAISSAHEISQGEVHDSSVCVTCSIGSGQDGVPAATVECPVTECNKSKPAFTNITASAAVLRQLPEARAPPSTL